MKLIKYFSVMLSLQAGAQIYTPFAGKWNAGDKKDFTAVWKTDGDVHYGLLDGEGNCSVNSITAKLGETGGKPIAMNFSGGNKDAIAIYNSATRKLTLFNDIFSRKSFFSKKVGKPGDQFFAGDWDGKGKDGFALYRPSTKEIFFYKKYNSVSPFYTTTIDAKGIIVKGDWDGNGKDGFAVYVPSKGDFLFYQNITDTKPYQTIATGNTDCLPVSGDWDGDSKDGVGLFKKMNDGRYKFFLFNNLSPTDMDDNFIWNDNADMYNMSQGRQIFYTAKVPHTDIDGNPLSNYNPQTSFFPEGIYNIIPSKIPEIYSAGFNLGFLWSSYYPLTKETRDLLDATNNNFRTILYLFRPGGRPFTGKFDFNNFKKDVIGLGSIKGEEPLLILDTNGDNKPDQQFVTGADGYVAFSGKWDNAPNTGDGYALYNPNIGKGKPRITFFKDVSPTNYMESARSFLSVNPSGAEPIDIPLSGDWDGDGKDGYALYKPTTETFSFFQKITDSIPFSANTIGQPGDIPVTGDWDGKGKYSFALYRPSTHTFLFYRNITDNRAYQTLAANDAVTGDLPISGDWNGDGTYKVGLYRTTAQREKHIFIEYGTNGKLMDSFVFYNPYISVTPKKYVYGFIDYDEPTTNGASLATVQNIYDAYSKTTSQIFFHVDNLYLDPAVDKRFVNFMKFAVMGKASAHDDYPISDTSTNVTSIASIAKTISQARIATGETLPDWYVVQTFSQHIKSAEHYYLPSAAQLKAMVYTAIVHGATGFFDFAYQNKPINDPVHVQGISPEVNADVWQYAASVNKEIDSLKPFILSKTPAATNDNAFTIFTTAHPDPSIGEAYPIRTLLKVNPEGDYILIAVNMTNQVFNAVIGLPGAISPVNRKIKKLFETNGDIQTEAGSINDVFQPFDVHIYKIAATDLKGN
jgi:hypothetical protein